MYATAEQLDRFLHDTYDQLYYVAPETTSEMTEEELAAASAAAEPKNRLRNVTAWTSMPCSCRTRIASWLSSPPESRLSARTGLGLACAGMVIVFLCANGFCALSTGCAEFGFLCVVTGAV